MVNALAGIRRKAGELLDDMNLPPEESEPAQPGGGLA